MDAREVMCKDGSRWRVIAPSRSSPSRLDLVFESLDRAGDLLRGEATATELSELSDEALCFVLKELRDVRRETQ